MKNYFLILFIFHTFLFYQVNAQENSRKSEFELADKSTGWLEGFQKNLGGNEFSYHSFRNDVSKSLITRCNDGNMAIEWETAPVPANWSNDDADFLWIAALALTPDEYIFDVYINDVKRFEIPSSKKKTWSLQTDDGGKLSYLTVEIDHNNDAHGYMSLSAPNSWLEKGKGQKIKIVGRAKNSNTWIIVYQADDALQFLHNSIDYNVQMELAIEKTNDLLDVTVHAPFYLSGKTLNYTYGRKSGKIELSETEDRVTGAFTLPLSALNKPFSLSDSNGDIFLVKALGQESKTANLFSKGVLTNESKNRDGNIYLLAKRLYNPKTSGSLLALSESGLGDAKIYMMNSSHQDIAWVDSPEKCILLRDTMLITPLLELAEKNKNYRFDIEDALMIKEYIERHPEKKEQIKEVLNNGQLSCGSTYIQPYEEMYSGESLARQFYFGAKWLKDEFGYQANVYWNEDVPGRTLQMMQLMQKAGTKYMMISRFEPGLYDWYSPDGSSAVTYSPGHYGYANTALQKKFPDAAQFLASNLLEWKNEYACNTTSALPLLSDNDMVSAKDYSDFIQQWSNISELQDKNGRNVPTQLPEIQVASAPEFFEALMANNPTLKQIKGERPAVWLYIHGPSHQKAIKTSREGDILLTQAEKFATANALADGSFVNYPQAELHAAWEAKIYPDHGWGGNQGDITDALFHSKYMFTKAEAEKVLDKSLSEIAAKVKTQKNKGRPLVVFNSLNWQRNDPVSIQITFNKSAAFSVALVDYKNNKIKTQVSDVEYHPDGSIKTAKLYFLAKDIPSIGYKTYYLQPSKEKITEPKKTFNKEIENAFYKLKFADGGLESIFDKELTKELIEGGKFTAGEVFTMRSEGNGAGEFSDIQQPGMEGFDKTGNSSTHWEVEEDGSVFTTYKYRSAIRNAVVEQRVKLYHQQKRIDFETALLNWEGELYREFRMAFPLNMKNGQVAYEVPFGVVEVGKDEMVGAAGERYKTSCKDFHPRGIENWISSSNDDFGVTMSSSVAVADWIDPTDSPVENQILQPILLASRRSCHWEGNEYLQTGNHSFTFSVTSHKPGWENGAKFGREANEQLHAVWADNSYSNASLPEALSFFNIDQDNVLISTVKKAEDSNDVVFRIAELGGKDRMVNISCFKGIKQAKRTNLIEEESNDLEVNKEGFNYRLGHHSIETFKLLVELHQ